MSKTKQIHVAMFPVFAYGHLTPYLHLSNKLAERGHKISFFLPKSAQPKLAKLSHHPDLIHFFPLTISQVQGLPPGAETASDVPSHLQGLIFTAYDQTRDQVQNLLASLRPDFVFTDGAYWLPPIASQLNIKTVHFSALSAAINALTVVPIKKVKAWPMTQEELMEAPPGYPSQKLRFKPDEAVELRIMYDVIVGSGLSIHERITTCLRDSDAIAMRTCNEIEGPFCEYLAKVYKKPVFVTGPILPEIQTIEVEEKWTKWLDKFEKGSLVYCAFGTQITLQKDQFQELLLGFELTGRPFLVALSPPEGCKTVAEALPEGFEERIGGRGWVYGGWAPQQAILEHPSIGCFVSHCGFGSMWESLLSDCQIVLVPYLFDQIIGARLLVEELEVAVEVERTGENKWVSKESLCNAIELVMDKTSEVACRLKTNNANLRNILSTKSLQEEYMNVFVQNLQDLMYA